MPKHTVNPQGNEIAQNTKYEELIKLWHLYKLKIRSKRTSSDNSKIEKGLKTTPPKSRGPMFMLVMLT